MSVAAGVLWEELLVEAEEIVEDLDLSVAVGTGTDADGGDADALGDGFGKMDRDTFEHDGVCTCLLKRDSDRCARSVIDLAVVSALCATRTSIEIVDFMPIDDGFTEAYADLEDVPLRVHRSRRLPDVLGGLANEVRRRQAEDDYTSPARVLFLIGLHRARDLDLENRDYGAASDEQPDPIEARCSGCGGSGNDSNPSRSAPMKRLILTGLMVGLMASQAFPQSHRDMEFTPGPRMIRAIEQIAGSYVHLGLGLTQQQKETMAGLVQRIKTEMWMKEAVLVGKIGAIALASFCNDLVMPHAWASAMDIGGKYAGTLSGAMNFWGNVGGGLGPLGIGYILSWTNNNWNLTFYVSAAIYAAGTIFWLLLDPTTPLDERP